eukprot:COSAG01_NODE_48526_length_380_cov_1.437722_2_plen_78_part_01
MGIKPARGRSAPLDEFIIDAYGLRKAHHARGVGLMTMPPARCRPRRRADSLVKLLELGAAAACWYLLPLGWIPATNLD